MKRLFCSAIILTATISASCLTYPEFISNYRLGPSGCHQNGEIEVITDPIQIATIETATFEKLRKEGYTPAQAAQWSHVGIIAEDSYWVWIRDAVVFPSGELGTYNRMVWRSALSGKQGVGILPIFRDGRIGVNLNYRHSTRSWEIELPRGTRFEGEDPEVTARRECLEETGFELLNLEKIGELAPDTGMTNSVVPIYIGKIAMSKLSQPEASEAIHTTLIMTKEELLKGFAEGFITKTVRGKPINAACRDSFLAYALIRTLDTL